MSEGPSREWIEKWAELDKPVHSGTANELTYKTRAMTVVQHMLSDFDKEQASEAEAEKWTRRDFAIFEEEVIRCKEQHPHYTWNEIGRERQMLYVRTMQRLLAELRSEPKQASDCTAEELAKKALTLMQDRCLQLYSDSMKYTGAIADAIRPHLRPASDCGRKVRASVCESTDKQRYWQVEVRPNRWVCGRVDYYPVKDCKQHLEAIMAAAGAEVEWENE